MGGTYDPSNVVLLTIRQHALAHKKLFQQHQKYEDWLAWKALSGQISKKDLSEEVEQLRRQHISEGLQGRVVSQQTREKISRSNKGKPKSLKHRANLSAAQMGRVPWNKGKSWSTDVIQKFRDAKLGTSWSVARRQAFERSKEMV
jgi:hypothetical protein